MAKYAAFGTTLKIGGTAGTAIVNVTDIAGPKLGAEILDMTAHDSSGSYREIVPTFLDAGEVTCTIQYDPAHATHKNAAGGLLYLFANKTSSSFALVLPSTPATNIVFTAYVTGFEPKMPIDGALTADVTLKVSGAPTLP